MESPGWMNLDEGAKYLKVSRNTLDRWITEERVRAYDLPSGRGRRVRTEDLDEMLIQPQRTLSELQPRMAEFATYNGGNTEFQTIAVMVRDASSGLGQWPRATVEVWLKKAEATNDPNKYRGRLIRQARRPLLEYVHEREKPLTVSEPVDA